ncbi:MAG: sulfatase-like hydrolase/transferase [Rikenellaceae bacterium]
MKRELALATLTMGLAAPQLFAAQSKEPQNVIFILIDDISYFGTSTYGARQITTKDGKFTKPLSTPNIDRLAQQGIQCTHAYAHALSEATRVALMTGMNNGRNFLEPKALHESQITFGDVFQHEGYATAMFGKWKQTRGTSEVPANEYISTFGWDEYACFDVSNQMQRYINPLFVKDGDVVSYKGRKDLDPETERRWYTPDIFNRYALDFIDRNQDKPFFLYYPMVLVHAEHRPTPDTRPTDEFDTMPEGDNGYNKPEYLADMIEYADKLIGRVVDRVDELGLRENTLIVVMGDNGSQTLTFEMSDGTKHVGGKGEMNYAGEQVPLIFSKPGTIPTSGEDRPIMYDGVVDVTDIYPTIMESCDIDVPNPEKIDGISLWDQLRGKENTPHREIVYKWYNANFKQTQDSLVSRYAHTADHKYYAGTFAFPEGRFFDLNEDPLEYGGVLGPMITKYKKYWHGGIELDKLTKEQREIMAELKAVTDAHSYQAVSSIEITKAPKQLKVGNVVSLTHEVLPHNATRNGVVWESSDENIATVNKFGEVTPLHSGEVTITLYSWDDAWPAANGAKGGYLRTGMKDAVTFTVK